MFGVKHFPSRGKLFLFLQQQLSSISAVLFHILFTAKVTWRIIRKCAPFNTAKGKCYLFLNEKLEISSYKGGNTLGQNLVTSVDTKTISPFYSMIARTKSYVFTEIFLAVFPLRPPFWPARLMFCIICFRKQKSSSTKRQFYRRILLGIFPVKTAWKWRHSFV